MIKLKEIFEEISNDGNITELDIKEQVDIQTYYLLLEIMDINNIYSYNTTGKFSAFFTDKNNIKHFIRMIYQPLQKIQDAWCIKFGFFDQNNKISYDRPNIIFNLKPDEKIFNTHIHILLNEFIENQWLFDKINNSKLYLPSTDYARYRLYKMAINKFLNKEKYKSYDCPEIKNCIIIEKI